MKVAEKEGKYIPDIFLKEQRSSNFFITKARKDTIQISLSFPISFSPHFPSNQTEITLLVLTKEKRLKVGQQSKKVPEKAPRERLENFVDRSVSVKVFCFDSRIRAKLGGEDRERQREGEGERE